MTERYTQRSKTKKPKVEYAGVLNLLSKKIDVRSRVKKIQHTRFIDYSINKKPVRLYVAFPETDKLSF